MTGAQIRQVYPDFYEVYYEVDLKGKGSCTCTGWAMRGKCRHVDQAREFEGKQAFDRGMMENYLKDHPNAREQQASSKRDD